MSEISTADAVAGFLSQNPRSRMPLDQQAGAGVLEAQRIAPDPDAEAKARRLAAVTGAPLEVARRDPKSLEAAATVNTTPWDKISRDNPRVAALLAEPSRAAIARDDVENLTVFESLGKQIWERTKNIGGGAVRFGATLEAEARKRGGTYGADQDREFPLAGKRVRGRYIVDPIDPFVREALTALERGPDSTPSMVTPEDVKRNWLMAIPFGLEQGIVSLPDMAAVMANPVMYWLTQSGRVAQERAQNDERPDAGLQDLLAALPASAAMALAERLGTTAVLGIGRAPVTSLRTLGRAAGIAGATEAGTEAAQEFLEYTATNLGTRAGFDFAEAGEATLFGAIGGGVGGTALAAPVAGAELFVNTRRQREAAAQAEEINNLVTDMNKAAAASLLRERDPQTFKAFVDDIAGPDGDLYADAIELAQVLEQSDMELDELRAKFPTLMQGLDVAAATGGVVRIPLSEIATYAAGTSLEQKIVPLLKTDPNGMSKAEAEAFTPSEQLVALQQEIEQVLAQDTNAEPVRAIRDQVKKQVLDRLNSAARFAPKTNEFYAEQWGAFAATYHHRLRSTPALQDRFLKMLENVGINARLPGVEGGATLDQERKPDPRTAQPMVNVGLSTAEVAGGGMIDMEAVLAILQDMGVPVVEATQHVSDTEPTAVVTLGRPLTAEEAEQLSVATRQEAVATWDGQAGELYGPAAEGWRPFNPEFFLASDGTRLKDIIGKSVLDQPLGKTVEDLATNIPGLAKLLPYLTDEEKAQLKAKAAEKLVNIVTTLPSPEEMAAVAWSGRAKRGWYESSARAILEVFGAADAPRFAALLAATSPQTSVEMNLTNALLVWTRWIKVGRPTGEQAIKEIMVSTLGRVKGLKAVRAEVAKLDKGEGAKGVLPAWVNNTLRALTAADPNQIELSGPKVNSFMLNLVGVVDEVTNDAWMANYALVDQALFSKASAVTNKGPGYLAMSARAREAAAILTAQTGETWSPAEVQETVWSWAKTLYETRDGARDATTEQILEAGLLNEGAIAATPDFALLFVNSIYRNILQTGGYGAQLNALERNSGTVQRDGGRGDPLDAEGSGFDPVAFRELLGQAARRLEGLREKRGAESARKKEQARTVRDQLTLFQEDLVEEAGWTPKRVRDLLSTYAYPGEPGKTKAWAARMSPRQFLDLTASPAVEARIRAETGPFDEEFLAGEIQPIFLIVEQTETGDWRVTGHEGRHRMVALESVGIGSVPVVLVNKDGGAYLRPAFNQRLLPQDYSIAYPPIVLVGGEGMIVLDHWSPVKGLTESDPSKWGASGKFLPRAERNTLGAAPARTYFGIASNQAGGYVPEFQGNPDYQAMVPYDRLYDMAANPKRLGSGQRLTPAEYETAIKEAGYLGYWVKNDQIGMVAAVFEPVALTPGRELPTPPAGERALAVSVAEAVPITVANRDRLVGGTDGGATVLFQAEEEKTPFYSPLERAIASAKITKGTGEQWLATLRNTPGVKQDELSETGIEEFLLGGQKSFTRDEVFAFAEANGVVIEEVLLGVEDANAREEYEARIAAWIADARAQDQQDVDETGDEGYLRSDHVLRADAKWALGDFETDNTQFSQYTLPGGENYRELLFKLPNNRAGDWDIGHFDGHKNVVAHVRFKTRFDADGKKILFPEEFQADVIQQGQKKGFARQGTPEEIAAAREAGREAARAEQDARKAAKAAQRGWARVVRERLEANKKALQDAGGWDGSVVDILEKHIERASEVEQFNAGYIPLNAYDWAGISSLEDERRAEFPEAEALWQAAKAERDAGLRAQEASVRYSALNLGTGIPTNPFIKTWEAMVMKRMIHWAATNGYDGIAWTTGAQQVERWPGNEGLAYFYDVKMVNITNNILKKAGLRVGEVQVQRDEGPGIMTRDRGMVREPMTQPGFYLNDALRQQAQGGMALFQNAKTPAPNPNARGQITFGPDLVQNPTTISLLETANLSTFLHETGHFFFEALRDLASQPDAPAEFKQDMDALLANIGIKPTREKDRLAVWNSMSNKERVDGHEKMARSYEGYLYSGKAPSLALDGVFQRFSAWLKQVYYGLKQLKINLTPEVTQVFDRMLATDEEIALAEGARSMLPLFRSAEEAGMDPAQWEAYQRDQQAAGDGASAELAAKGLRDMKWTRATHGKELARLKKEAAQTRAAVKREIEAQVRARPVYQAIEFLKKGLLPDGTQADTGFKLSIEEVEALYPEPAAQQLVKAKLGTGGYGMLGRENAIHPDQAAELFGFTSGDHLVRSILDAAPVDSEIEGLTEQRLLEEHAELFDEQSMNEAADAAVHNAVRARMVATEINALNAMLNAAAPTGKTDARGRPVRRRLLPEAARQFANATIARLKVRNLKPAMYAAAAERAARNADKARRKGDLETAAAEKRNQLFNLFAAKAANDAKSEVDRALRYFERVDAAGRNKKIDPDYRDQIDAILDRYDLRRSTTLRAIDRRKSLAEWVEQQRAMGLDPVIPQKLIDDTRLIHYKDLTVEELRDVVDAVRNIEHLGRLKTKLLAAKDKRELDVIAAEVEQTIRDNATSEARTIIERSTWIERAAKGVEQFFAIHRKWASLFRVMAGGKEGTVLWNVFVRPFNEAGDREARMREEATIALGRVLKPLTDAGGLRKKTYIPAIGRSLSLEARIVIALNWGNEQNRQRVMDGDKWSRQQVEAILGTLTAEQWGVVRETWAYLETFWPDIAAKERRVSGVVPGRVEPLPFEVLTADGQTLLLPGGYYPLKYDPDRSDKADADNMADMVKQAMQGAHTRATTRRGHTKDRAETVKRAVRKDLGVLFQHVTEVIHDLTHHEVLIDMNRLLGRQDITSAIRDHYGPEVLRALKKSVEDIAVGDVPAQNVFEASVNHLRTGVTIAGMGWNLMTGLLQPLGLTQSMVRIGPSYVAKGIGRMFGHRDAVNGTVDFVESRSDFMRLRAKTMQREISEIRNQIAGKSKTRIAVEESFFVMIAQLQRVADYPTWLGAYEAAYDRDPNIDDATASRLADQAVLDSQGGGQIKDLAGIQRGGPLMKLWTNFYSYFNVTYNLMSEQRAIRKLQKAPALLAGDVLLLMVLPSVLATLLREAVMLTVGAEPPDEEELIEKIAKDQMGYLLGTMVGLRELGSAISSPVGYNAPAGLRFFVEVGKLVKQVEQGEADEALFKAANNTAGIVLHYPSGQVQRTVTGIQALAEGDTANPMVVATGAPPER